jgi:selenide, water dikinase
MTNKAAGPPQNLVLVGGGHSHAIALLHLGKHPIPNTRLTLITEAAETPYSGMVPGHVAGLYSRSDCHIDLRPLAAFAGAELIIDAAVGLELTRRQVICAHHAAVDFDWLALDIGSTPQLPAGLSDRGGIIPAKPVGQFLARWEEILAQVERDPEQALCLGIVGGGAGGVELAVSMRQRLHQCLRSHGQPTDNLQLHLFQRDAALLPGYPAPVRDRLRHILTAQGIQLHFQADVCAVKTAAQSHQVICTSGLTVACDAVIGVTHAAAARWIAESGLAVDPAGFVQVDDALRSLSHPQVFATGDIATMVNHPRPKSGVFAVRQGPPLADNLRRALLDQPLCPFYPQQTYLSLIRTGDGAALGIRGNWAWRSPLLWWWKDWIDRRFMEQFRRLPSIADLV